jgi:hypothetical protein
MQRQRLVALDDSEWQETTWRRNSNESDVREPIQGFEYSRVREEIIRRSPGLFNVPPAWRESIPDPIGQKTFKRNYDPGLPDRAYAEHLIHLFQTEVFAISPYIALQMFVERANEMYDSVNERDSSGIPVDTSRSWLVLFFATLALTAHYIQDEIILQHSAAQTDPTVPIGSDLAEAAAFFFGPIAKKNTLDDIRGALMLAVYFKERNELETANMWLGLSCKIAQHLGNIRFTILIRRMPSLFSGI